MKKLFAFIVVIVLFFTIIHDANSQTTLASNETIEAEKERQKKIDLISPQKILKIKRRIGSIIEIAGVYRGKSKLEGKSYTEVGSQLFFDKGEVKVLAVFPAEEGETYGKAICQYIAPKNIAKENRWHDKMIVSIKVNELANEMLIEAPSEYRKAVEKVIEETEKQE